MNSSVPSDCSCPGVRQRLRRLLAYTVLMGLTILGSTVTLYASAAATTVVPWDSGITNVISIFSGQTARLLGALMFIGGALMWRKGADDDIAQLIGKVILTIGLIIGSLSLSEFIFGSVV